MSDMRHVSGVQPGKRLSLSHPTKYIHVRSMYAVARKLRLSDTYAVWMVDGGSLGAGFLLYTLMSSLIAPCTPYAGRHSRINTGCIITTVTGRSCQRLPFFLLCRENEWKSYRSGH